MKRKLLLLIGLLILLLVLTVLGYMAYLFSTYHRIADNVPLEVQQVIQGGMQGNVQVKAEPVLQEGVEYSAITYNIGFGAYTPDFSFFMDGGAESRAKSQESVINVTNACIDDIKKWQPDFILIQEVDRNSTRSYHIDQFTILQKAFFEYVATFSTNYDSAYLFYPFTQPHGKSYAGLGTFSRYTINSALRRSFPIATDINKFFDLDRCFSVHCLPVENGKNLYLYNAHLSAYVGTPELLAAQINTLFGDMAAKYQAGHYVLVGGDFNMNLATGNSPFAPEKAPKDWTQIAFPFNLLPHGISLVSSYENANIPTLRDSGEPYTKGITATGIVDGFFASANIEIIHVENVDANFAHSDHNPVYLRFALKQSQ